MADEELESCFSALSAAPRPDSLQRRRHVAAHPLDAIAFAPALFSSGALDPHRPPATAVAAAAGYRLREEPPQREGEAVANQVKFGALEWLVAGPSQNNAGGATAGSSQPQQQSLSFAGRTAQSAAVLDVAWRPRDDVFLGPSSGPSASSLEEVFPLAVADSAGCVRFGAFPSWALAAVAASAENAVGVDGEQDGLDDMDGHLGDPLAPWADAMLQSPPGSGDDDGSSPAVVVAPGDGAMVLSVEWQRATLPASPFDAGTVVASTSSGAVALVQTGGVAAAGTLVDASGNANNSNNNNTGGGNITVGPDVAVRGSSLLMQFQAHDYEAWIAAGHTTDPNIVYSGGDDCAFRVWDVRTAEAGRPALAKRFDMGVTGIQHSPHSAVQPHLVAVGSYDESLTLLDCRMVGNRNVARVGSLGGAAWRVRWHPSDPWLIGVPCMRAGFRVLRFAEGGGSSSHGSHGSGGGGSGSGGVHLAESFAFREAGDCEPIGYGLDWHPDAGTGTLGVCSFYDCVANLWTP
jgi:hypothetical protein